MTTDYRVYFQHPTLTTSHEDVTASSYFEAEAFIASKYGLATHIKATPLSSILPDWA